VPPIDDRLDALVRLHGAEDEADRLVLVETERGAGLLASRERAERGREIAMGDDADFFRRGPVRFADDLASAC
jgi:hypothetical protein